MKGMTRAKEQIGNLLRRLNGYNLAYVYLFDSRVMWNVTAKRAETFDSAFDACLGTILVAGKNTPELAKKLVDDEGGRGTLRSCLAGTSTRIPTWSSGYKMDCRWIGMMGRRSTTAKNVQVYLGYAFSAESLAVQAWDSARLGCVSVWRLRDVATNINIYQVS
jgi:hypothetical protein